MIIDLSSTKVTDAGRAKLAESIPDLAFASEDIDGVE